MEKFAPYVGYIGGGITLVFVPDHDDGAVAGILLAIFNALLGGSASFKQVAAVMSHAGAVSLMQQLFIFPLNYARESMSSADQSRRVRPVSGRVQHHQPVSWHN